MTLFLQSTKAVSAACQEIADSAGASADTEMCNRAWRSLNAALQYIDGKAFWDFALMEPAPISVKGVFQLALSATAGSVTASAVSATAVSANDFIVGVPFTPGTRVTATAGGATGTAVIFNVAVTALTGSQTSATTVSVGRDTYSVPSDFKYMHSARMLATQRTLRMLRRRMYDRATVDEFAVSNTPLYYDVFLVGGQGVIRFLPPPNVDDVFQWRYFRHLATASASSVSAALDIPSQYESYLVALAKWFFLVDKSEGRGEQAQTWSAFAQEGIRVMLRENVSAPDEDLMMIPGAYNYNVGWGPNSTRPFLDEPW